MDKFLNWMRDYNIEISWFIIGILTQSGLENLARGQWELALFNFGVALANFFLYKKN
jgi:hypothetical protein